MRPCFWSLPQLYFTGNFDRSFNFYVILLYIATSQSPSFIGLLRFELIHKMVSINLFKTKTQNFTLNVFFFFSLSLRFFIWTVTQYHFRQWNWSVASTDIEGKINTFQTLKTRFIYSLFWFREKERFYKWLGRTTEK